MFGPRRSVCKAGKTQTFFIDSNPEVRSMFVCSAGSEAELWCSVPLESCLFTCCSPAANSPTRCGSGVVQLVRARGTVEERGCFGRRRHHGRPSHRSKAPDPHLSIERLDTNRVDLCGASYTCSGFTRTPRSIFHCPVGLLAARCVSIPSIRQFGSAGA
ncbi:hypothetical protein CC80DRAFT_33401 [Byssothecium circinans]|uniref:Uncharacterized protein n=1 Tax=Byssothecium circinans TaxID=147558 RepID=A0A6A5TZJ3_9PLEO|nr:hypothetical protein CC80DRAFT_33401 [Byssothecium circinans]